MIAITKQLWNVAEHVVFQLFLVLRRCAISELYVVQVYFLVFALYKCIFCDCSSRKLTVLRLSLSTAQGHVDAGCERRELYSVLRPRCVGSVCDACEILFLQNFVPADEHSDPRGLKSKVRVIRRQCKQDGRQDILNMHIIIKEADVANSRGSNSCIPLTYSGSEGVWWRSFSISKFFAIYCLCRDIQLSNKNTIFTV